MRRLRLNFLAFLAEILQFIDIFRYFLFLIVIMRVRQFERLVPPQFTLFGEFNLCVLG